MSDFSELIHKDFLHDARQEKAFIYEHMNPCPKSKKYPLRKYGYEYHCHPMYRTTSKEYGFYPPNCVSVPFIFKPRQSKFSKMYAMDRSTNTKLNLYRGYRCILPDSYICGNYTLRLSPRKCLFVYSSKSPLTRCKKH